MREKEFGVEMLRALPNMTDGERLDTQVAVATLWALWEELPEGAGDISIAGIPDDKVLQCFWRFVPQATSTFIRLTNGEGSGQVR